MRARVNAGRERKRSCRATYANAKRRGERERLESGLHALFEVERQPESSPTQPRNPNYSQRTRL